MIPADPYAGLGPASVIRGNALELPLPDASVDLIVTSPPYFALRSYQDGGQHYDGQIGSEATPDEFVTTLLAATREMVRVLKPSGSLWVNLGDKYNSAASGQKGTLANGRAWQEDDQGRRYPALGAMRTKTLLGMPWRYALRCIDELGLILRAEVIWSKPNGLPESVTDRVRRSHEQWFAFQRSDSEVVEPGPEAFPFCPVCGRPKDARATLIARLHELDSGVEDGDLSHEERPHKGVQAKDASGANKERVIGTAGSTVPLAVPADGDVVEDSTDLLDDGRVPVVDEDAQVRAASPAVAQGHGSLAVDDSSQPGEVCSCRHPLIVDDEPWIPQSLAADLMQMVADGEADPQAVADFLSGDYARTHSTWFHFTVSPRYFAAVDEIREPYDIGSGGRQRAAARGTFDYADKGGEYSAATAAVQAGMSAQKGFYTAAPNPLGKLPGSVREVPSAPLKVPAHLGVDHFAAFPPAWPAWIIRGWSPAGVCVECGEGRRPVVDKTLRPIHQQDGRRKWGNDLRPDRHSGVPVTVGANEVTITGYACACPTPDAPTRPAVVLDPFGGTGTTAMAARALGRHGVSVDLSADYCRLARWRVQDMDELAAVRGIPRQGRKADDAQVSLLDMLDGEVAS